MPKLNTLLLLCLLLCVVYASNNNSADDSTEGICSEEEEGEVEGGLEGYFFPGSSDENAGEVSSIGSPDSESIEDHGNVSSGGSSSDGGSDIDMNDWEGYLQRLVAPAMSGEAILNQLMDRQCDRQYLVHVLRQSLQRADFPVFQTACVACYQQYDPDEVEFTDLLESTIALGAHPFFEALLEGQCKGRMGQLVLASLPNLNESFLAPALRLCGSVIPRHAVDVWRAEHEAGKEREEGEVVQEMDWATVQSVTDDLHTYISWPPASSKMGLIGIWAEYSASGEGKISMLNEGNSKLFVNDQIVALCGEEPLEPGEISQCETQKALHEAFNYELYNSSNRFRAVGAVFESVGLDIDKKELRMSVERLNDGGPMLIVYRDCDPIYPPGLVAYDPNIKTDSFETFVWAQPKPTLFLPVFLTHDLVLQKGDILILAPPSLQECISEIDLRGYLYAADRESLHEVVAGLLKTLYLKTKKHVAMGAAIAE